MLRSQRFLFIFAALLVGLLGLGSTFSAHAQVVVPASGSSIPSAQVVNSDGTLNLQTGASGALDLAGWNVALDPQRGPVLKPDAPTASKFSGVGNGANNSVTVIVVSGSNVYVGGCFTTVNAGLVKANGVARWNGSSWSALGNGVQVGCVHSMAVNGSDVYVGGQLFGICGNPTCDSGNTPINNIAHWNGSSWSTLGDGLDSSVLALAMIGSDLYAGGQFGNSGSTPVSHIARWNGSAWSALGSGVDGEVDALAVSGGNLYAAGHFINAGVTRLNQVGRWNGSAWSALGNGLGGIGGFAAGVFALAVSGTDVYAGGYFNAICGNPNCDTGNTIANSVARWNGSSWSALGNGLGGKLDDASVFSLAVNGSTVYAAGRVTRLCTNADCSTYSNLLKIAQWNGTTWSPLDQGLNQDVYALATSGSDLYAGGFFQWACASSNFVCIPDPLKSTLVNHIGKYSASSGCATKPPKPVLVKPRNSAILKTLTPTLSWRATNCADTYNITITKESNGKKVASAKGLTSLQFTPAKPLANNAIYDWVVQACNSKGCTPSQPRNFIIKTH